MINVLNAFVGAVLQGWFEPLVSSPTRSFFANLVAGVVLSYAMRPRRARICRGCL